MGQTSQLAAQIMPWVTPVMILTVFGLIWRGMVRLEDRLGKRIDDTNKRIDGLSGRIDGIGARLRALENGQAEIRGKLDFVEAYILGRNDTRTVPAE